MPLSEKHRTIQRKLVRGVVTLKCGVLRAKYLTYELNGGFVDNMQGAYIVACGTMLKGETNTEYAVRASRPANSGFGYRISVQSD